MSVLVTGSNGFLGSALISRLLDHNEQQLIRCFHRPGSNLSRLKSIEQRYPKGKIEFFKGTLTSKEDCVRALKDVDMVYHLAAATSGAPAEMFLNSVVASKNLLDALISVDKNIKVVFVSSFGVYGMANVKEGSLVDETIPLEPHPERRDIYSHTKLRQEELLQNYQERYGFPLIILRPGVIYGPGGSAISGRVGLNLFGFYLYLGRKNLLPLSYVDNCADAIIAAARNPAAVGQIYNVHDDELPNAKEYLNFYTKEVKKLRTIYFPFFMTKIMSHLVEKYHHYSKGQLPAIFTPYKTDSIWRSFRYDNIKIKSIGWRQHVSTKEGLKRTFQYLSSLEEE